MASEFNKKDIVERFIKASGRGGQNVNKLATCVYLKHLATGIEVKCDRSRHQNLNRKLARELLSEKIKEHYRKKKAQRRSESEKRKRQNRKRPGWLKEKILDAKKRHSAKKNTRRSVTW